jgi:hypothetical protein
MGAGHFAQSGLYDHLNETALKYAFLLSTASECHGSLVAEGAAATSWFIVVGSLLMAAFLGASQTVSGPMGGTQNAPFESMLHSYSSAVKNTKRSEDRLMCDGGHDREPG